MSGRSIDQETLKFINTSVLLESIRLDKNKIKHISLNYYHCKFSSLMKLIDRTELNFLRLNGDTSYYKRGKLFNEDFKDLNGPNHRSNCIDRIYRIDFERSNSMSFKEGIFDSLDIRVVYSLLRHCVDLTKIETLSLIDIEPVNNYNIKNLLSNLHLSSLKKLTCNSIYLNDLILNNFEFPSVFSELYLICDGLEFNLAFELFTQGLKFEDNYSSNLKKINVGLITGKNNNCLGKFEEIVNLLINKYESLTEMCFHVDKDWRMINDGEINELASKFNINGPKYKLYSIESHFNLIHNKNLKIFITLARLHRTQN
jgi:hypothetical protein